ncbi:hypothetical protein E4T56_gene7971 [Termitomyces sp. T112]|nr:hypothetical protein E4T56_gene7971 [Termitomyces sp. T112]
MQPDIQYSVGIISQYGSNPGKTHLEATKRVLCYLKGTADMMLVFGRSGSKKVDLIGWTDFNWVQDIDSHHSIGGFVFDMAGESILWSLEGEQTLIDANKSSPAAADTSPIVFMAKTLRYKKLGSGMARKMVEELRTAQITHYNAQCKVKGKGKAASRVTITLVGGSAFMVEGNSDIIAAYIAMHKGPATLKAEFAELPSDSFPAANSLAYIETLEFDTLLVFEEEMKESTDQQNDINHKQTGEIVLSSSTSPLERSPFYLNSGMTVHISPDPSDFITLKLIPEHLICSVGGLAIAAMGIGSI